MRNLRSYVLGSGALFLLGAAVPLSASCSSGQAPAQGDSGAGSSGMGGSGGTSGSGGSGGTMGTSDEGGGSISCGTGCYAPVGCGYQVAPPESSNRSLGYTNFSVDTSTAVGSTTGAAPQRVRLGLGGGTTAGQAGYADPTTSMAFTWETTEQDTDAKVQIGTSSGSLTDTYAGYVFSLSSLGTTLNMHEVHVCGLKPGTTYYYHVGGGAPTKEVWGATQSFTTVPATGSIKIGAYGDARDSVAVWQTVNAKIKAHDVAMSVMSGDVVLLGSAESEWAQWFDAIWDQSSEMAAMGMSGGMGVSPQPGFLTLGEQLILPIAGNHEDESAVFYANFALPGTGDWAETYASFNAGNTHFVLFDDSPLASASSASSLPPEAMAQVAWLDADLAAAAKDRTNHPFIVFVSHRGMYSTSNHSADPDVLIVRSVIAPILAKYTVDLVLNGHDHEYERSVALTPNTSNPASNTVNVQSDATKGTTYVINAGAGASAYSINSLSGTQNYRAKSWEFDFSTAYVGCYGILELDGNTLTLTEYGVKGSASSDDVIDTLKLTR